MERIGQTEKARAFQALHASNGIFVLPNAWDAVSTKIFEREGFPGIATTSGGIASMLGYADGERMSLNSMLEAVGRIVASTTLPVSADVEAGYGRTPADVERTTVALLETGAVGMNLEDRTPGDRRLLDTVLQCERIGAAREVCEHRGIPLVINARTDSYLIPNEDPTARRRETVTRGNAYLGAGADCVFVPDVGALDESTIKAIAEDIDGPINVLASPQSPSLRELERLGVRRVTFGPRAMRATLALLQRIAREIRLDGTFCLMTEGEIGYAEVNSWFEDRVGLV